MHEDFLSFYDLIQFLLTGLALYCVYWRGYYVGADDVMEMFADPEDDKKPVDKESPDL